MIVLDTNVVSELIRPRPTDVVLAWVRRQPATTLYTTTTTLAEVLLGIELLSPGRRREQLAVACEDVFEQDFAGRVLTFEAAAAAMYAAIVAGRRRLGRPIAPFDAQIAAIARSRGAAVATRNVSDFVDCGVTVLDPWKG